MRRASHNITLVLVSAALTMHGCDHQPSVVGPAQMSEAPVGTMPDTLPGTQPSTYRHIPPYYYNSTAFPIVPARTGSVARSGSSRSTGSGFSWGSGSRTSGSSGGWGSSSGSGSSHKSSSSVSRGGFGSSSKSVSS